MIAGPDSRAQIAIQAAERLRTLGAGVPWEVCPPLPPALLAALSFLPGMTPRAAYLTLVALAFAGSAALVFLLWRSLGAGTSVAAQAALVALAAPSGYIAIVERGEIETMLFWKLVPLALLAGAAIRRRPGALSVGLLLAALAVLALTRSARWTSLDLLALAEWGAVFALCAPWRAPTKRRRLAAFGGVGSFLCIALVRLPALEPPGPPTMPAALAAPDAVGPVSLDAELHPFAAQVHERINSDLGPQESLLWLRAFGAKSVLAPRDGKFHGQLECVREENGWCLFDIPGPSPPAVFVSRDRFATLEPIRGLTDVEGLLRYVTWSARPEAVGFERRGDTIVVRGDAGPYDLVLVRVNAAEWSTTAHVSTDPLGFLVLDPGGPGPFEATLHHDSAPPAYRLLEDGDFPQLAPEGVVDAVTYAGSPFPPGGYVAIYGERFQPDALRVLIDGLEVKLEYASATQINIRLADDIQPGPHSLVVENAGRRTYPYAFEVQAR